MVPQGCESRQRQRPAGARAARQGPVAGYRIVRMGVFDDLRLGYEASQETYREYAREAFIADLLVRDPDGYWRFAISLTLDRDAETFPKQHLAFFLRLKPLAGIWNVQLLDDGFQEFHIPSARNDERQPLFEHIVGMVTRLLAAKPWEGIEKL